MESHCECMNSYQTDLIHTHTRIHKMVKWKFLLTCGPRASNPLFFLVNTFSAYIFGFSVDCHRFHTIFGTIVQYKPFNMLTDCKESKWKRNKQPAYVSQTFLHRAIASSTLYHFTSLRSTFIFTNWILKYLKTWFFLLLLTDYNTFTQPWEKVKGERWEK